MKKAIKILNGAFSAVVLGICYFPAVGFSCLVLRLTQYFRPGAPPASYWKEERKSPVVRDFGSAY